MTVEIKRQGSELYVRSPYNPEFVAGARTLGGRWAPPAWVFDARDEDIVRELCVEVYGSSGAAGERFGTIRVMIKAGTVGHQEPLRLGGREIAAARGRDTGATLGAGVILLTGKFDSGGSVKNWKTTCVNGAEVLIRDVPQAMIDRLLTGNTPEWVESVSVETEDAPIDRIALAAERAKLLARVAEIDRLMMGDAQ